MERVNKMLHSAGSSVRAKMEAAAAVRAGLAAAAEADAVRPWPFPQGEAPFPQGEAPFPQGPFPQGEAPFPQAPFPQGEDKRRLTKSNPRHT